MKKAFTLFLVFFALRANVTFAASYGIGPHILISMPRNDFANVSGSGEGFGIKGYFDISSMERVSLRADFGFLTYGDRLQTSIYGFVQTRNEALQLSIGPQFMLKYKRLGAYFAPMIGIFNYSTIVSIPDLYYSYYNYSERKDNKTKWGWSVGGGLLYDIGLGPWLDVSVKYGMIKGIVETQIDDRTIKSDAVDISITLGVLFFLDR